MQRIYNYVTKYYELDPFHEIENPFRLAILKRTRGLHLDTIGEYRQHLADTPKELNELITCLEEHKIRLKVVESLISQDTLEVEQIEFNQDLNKLEESIGWAILMENSKVASCLLDANENFVLANKAMEKFLDRSRTELSSYKFQDVLSFEFRLNRSIQKMTIEDAQELAFQDRFGDTKWGLAQTSELVHQGDSYTLVQIQDITSYKNISPRNPLGSDLLDRINQNINEGIYRSEVGKGFIYVNDAFLKMFGYQTIEEINEVGINTLYLDPNEKRRLRKKLMIQKVIRNEEIHLKTRSGRKFIGSLSSSLSRDDSGRLFLDGALRDITESKLTKKKLIQLNSELINRNSDLAIQEEELAANNNALQINQKKLERTLEELSTRNFELDQLMYKTSHDLRSPLSSILGLIQLMELDEDPANFQECLAKIKRSISRLDEFIRSMLDYGRANKGQLNCSTVNFEELLSDVLETLDFTVPGREMNVSKEIAEFDNQIGFVNDPLLVRVLFSNIISNAFKYSDPYKDSYLRITINCTPRGMFVTFEDNGIGIEQKHSERIFDMFYRGTESSRGSGLGLYIVKQIIEKLNGKIHLASTFTEGTTIRVFLPNQC